MPNRLYRAIFITLFSLGITTPGWGDDNDNNTLSAISECQEGALSTAQKIHEIRQLYADINKYHDDYQSITLPLDEEGDGSEATAYFDGDAFVKLIKRYYSTTGKRVLEYYIAGTDLRFVFEVKTNYNGAFREDRIDKSKYTQVENRYYLFCGKLIRWLDDDKRLVATDNPDFIEAKTYWEHEAAALRQFFLE